jgi:hypothetical protein
MNRYCFPSSAKEFREKYYDGMRKRNELYPAEYTVDSLQKYLPGNCFNRNRLYLHLFRAEEGFMKYLSTQDELMCRSFEMTKTQRLEAMIATCTEISSRRENK